MFDLLQIGVRGVEKQGCRLDAVVPESPAIGQRRVDFQKMGQASGETAFHVGVRNGMPAHFDTLGNPANGQGRRWDPEVVDFDLVAGGFGLFQELGVGGAAESAFEAEGMAGFHAGLDFPKQEFTGSDGELFRIQRREAAGDFVGIQEARDGIKLAEIGTGEGGFARSVGTCEEVEGGCGGWHVGEERCEDCVRKVLGVDDFAFWFRDRSVEGDRQQIHALELLRREITHIPFHHIPIGAVQAQRLAGLAVELHMRHGLKPFPLQSKRLSTRSRADFDAGEAGLGNRALGPILHGFF